MTAPGLMKRVLGVDFGQARIGVAVSDELGMLAHPVETVLAVPADKAARRIAELARDKDVSDVVVGLPRHMSGGAGEAAAAVEAFVEKLRPLLSCSVILWDERLSTTAANRALRDVGRKTRNTRGVVDQVAAQIILQGYLDRMQSRRENALPRGMPPLP